MTRPIRTFVPAFAVVLAATLGIASPAEAANVPTTRLVSCPSGSCLVVAGRRASSDAVVLINQHAVSVDGSRRWQVRLPVATVREWSEPQARSITVAIYDPATESRTEHDADLPIGLLGHTSLETIVVAMR